MISLECPYCATVLITAAPAPDQAEEAFRSAWKSFSVAQPYCACPGCVGEFQINDDGDPDGMVELGNVTRPNLDSLNIATGPRTGGNALFVSGVALDIGTLVVKFAGQVCPVVDTITPTSARVVVPVATYDLNVAERAHFLMATLQFGTISVDENVTTPAGSTGIVRRVEGSTYWVAFASLNESLEDMVGVNMVGGTSGGFATIDAVSLPVFEIGEQVSGGTSVAQATVKTSSPLTVEGPTQGFAPQELVLGNASNALVRLTASPAYSGLVDVSVENEHGQRLAGGNLPDAYTYA